MFIQPAKRRLQDTAFAPNSVLQLPLPKDLVARFLFITLHGSTAYAFSSGTPAAPKESSIDTLIPLITVTVNGRLVKSVRPHMLHMLEILAFGQEGERRSSAGASAVTGDLPTADGGFAWGTTTQVTTVRESLCIPFEHVLAKNGRNGTWLDLRGKNAEVKFSTGSYSSLNTDATAAGAGGLAFSSQSVVIEAYIEEVLGVPDGAKLADFKQTWNQETIGAAVTDKSFELNTGNLISGLSLYVKNGATPSVPADLGLTSWKIMTGNRIVKQGDFSAEQGNMRQQFKCNAPRAANASRLDGYVHISLLTNDQDLNTSYDARELKSLRLVLSTHASATYPLTVNLEQHEIVQ